MMRVGSVWPGCRTICWGSRGWSRWRCSSVAAGCWANDSPATTANQSSTQQKASVSVRRWVDKPSGMHHTHLALDPERDAKLWSAIDTQLATIKQGDGNSGTPIDQLLG